MKEFSSVDDILDFAIGEEEQAFAFYTDLAGQMDSQAMKKTFLDFAQEEKGHKAKLLAIKKGKVSMLSSEQVADLKIGDYLVDVDVDTEAKLTYQDALIVAMKKEKAAFRLYTDLASKTDDGNLRETLLNLAQEEAKHKLRFEVEYDDYVFDEN